MFGIGAITGVRHSVAAAMAVDRGEWSGPARSAALVELLDARERLDALISAVAGEWDAAGCWRADGARSAPSWLARRVALTRQDASDLVRTARHVHAHEHTAKALDSGDITSAHAQLAARAARHREDHSPEHEDVILDAARRLDPSAFRVVMAHWASVVDDLDGRRRPHDGPDTNYLDLAATFAGVGHLEGRFDPAATRAIIARLDEMEPPDPTDGPHPPRTLAQRRAAAFLRLIHGEPARATVNVDVILDVDTLAGRPSPDLTTGCCAITGIGPVAPSLARTLACDCAIGRVLMRGASEVLDLGRRTRLVTPALRRMLEIRDRSCVEPGCDIPAAWCDAHHITPWWAHGPTDLDNLELRCRVHHLATHRRDEHARGTARRRE